jgi:hypothetical protein
VPGYKWTYKTSEIDEETEEVTVTETITVEVLDESIMIEGVKCVVVRDIVYDGDIDDPNPVDNADDILEDTNDWYGQQINRTVWYFGEFSLAKEDCEDDEESC